MAIRDVSAPKVGDEAPDFTLKSHLDKDVTLADYRGKKNVVLAFYPLAFTPV
jgi:peroxiredoxin